MKLAVASLVIASTALVGGCAVYPDGTPAYATGGYPAYPAQGYDPGYGYYGGPVVESGVIIGGGGGYYGGPGPRYYNDGRNYQRGPNGYYGGDRGGKSGR